MELMIQIKNKKDYELIREITKRMGIESREMPSKEKKYPELSDHEIQLLEDRWTDYIKNPKATQTWDEVKKELKKKHAR